MAETEGNAVEAISPVTEELNDALQATESPSITTTLPLESKPLASAISLPPLFINSIAELKDLSAAISAFQDCYEDLHNHLEDIKAALLSVTSERAYRAPHDNDESALPNDTSREERLIQKQKKKSNPKLSELEDLCKSMSSRGVKKYVAGHLSDPTTLREELPQALMLSLDPAELVLESLGKFYLQGSKAYVTNSPMIPARKASIFILECFLLMIGMNADGALDLKNVVKAEAEIASLAWRKRLIAEGGLDKASLTDARGLLFFVACFGIPALFKRGDVRDLLIASDAKEIVGILQNSRTLMDMIPEIADEMIKNKMEVNAVDIIYTFGLEEKFDPQSILHSFLQDSEESILNQNQMPQVSPAAIIAAKKKQLSSLTALTKCLRKHDVDAEKLLPGWQISEKIATLEREIPPTADNTSRAKPVPPNRKLNEGETSKKPKSQQAKRARHTIHGPPRHKAVDRHHNRRDFLSNSYSASPPVFYGGPAGAVLPSDSAIPYGSYSTEAYRGQAAIHGTHPYIYTDPANNEGYSWQPSSLSATNGNQSSSLDQYHVLDSVW